ncbi:MAG: DUF1232 domain-containing protein [Planctomycetes bacterium]|nr:DUF1232 domain-containing protein [Planctomycetota bacterium]
MKTIVKIIKNLLVLGLGALSFIYLLNPTFGLFELIPDNTPLVGNLDEAGAVILLMNCLRYYGIDITSLFSGKQEKEVDAKEVSGEE